MYRGPKARARHGFGWRLRAGLAILLAALAVTAAPAEPAPRDIPSAAAVTAQRRAALAEALQDGYGLQYWGEGYTAEQLAEGPHGLLILEATKLGATDNPTGREVPFSPEEIARISRGGTRPVIGYLNLSEAEPYRDYWVAARFAGPNAMSAWLGPRTETQEQLTLYWAPSWEEILRDRVDRLMALGLDGLFLDDVLHYYNYAVVEPRGSAADWPETPSDFACAMMGLVERLAARARMHRGDAMILVNNGVFIGYDAGLAKAGAPFASYATVIDGILVEDLFANGDKGAVIDTLQTEFLEHGIQVLTVDFVSHFGGADPEEVRQEVAERATALRFAAYVADDTAYDRLYPPITGSVLPPAD